MDPLAAAVLSDGAGTATSTGSCSRAAAPRASPDAGTMATLADYASSFGSGRSVCSRVPTRRRARSAVRVDTRASPLTLTYTAAGVALFGGYAVTTSLDVSGVDAAVAPVADAGPRRALLVDDGGNAAAASTEPPTEASSSC